MQVNELKDGTKTFHAKTRKDWRNWIQNAKKAETREKRINETASLASKNIRANQYKK